MNSKIHLFFLLIGLFMIGCSSDSETASNEISIIGTWNLVAFNDSPDEVYCPKTIVITANEYTENEFGGLNCDEPYSFTKSYILENNEFILNQDDIENTVYTILTLNEDNLEWETTTPNANQILKYSYERVE